MMTLMELQETLGRQMKAIDEAVGGTKDFQYVMEKAEYVVWRLQERRRVKYNSETYWNRSVQRRILVGKGQRHTTSKKL